MTGPKNPSPNIAPVRRRGAFNAPATSEAYEEPEVARGQADAILGALGRMQLRLDVLTREQGESLDKIYEAINRLNSRLDEYEEFAEVEEVENAEAFASFESAVAPETATPVESADAPPTER